MLTLKQSIVKTRNCDQNRLCGQIQNLQSNSVMMGEVQVRRFYSCPHASTQHLMRRHGRLLLAFWPILLYSSYSCQTVGPWYLSEVSWVCSVVDGSLRYSSSCRDARHLLGWTGDMLEGIKKQPVNIMNKDYTDIPDLLLSSDPFRPLRSPDTGGRIMFKV